MWKISYSPWNGAHKRSAFPSSVPNEMRLDETGDHSRIAGTRTVLEMPGLVAWDNTGKIWENSGRDGTAHYITYFSNQKEISHPVPNFRNFSRIFPKFQIWEFPFHFWD